MKKNQGALLLLGAAIVTAIIVSARSAPAKPRTQLPAQGGVTKAETSKD